MLKELFQAIVSTAQKADDPKVKLVHEDSMTKLVLVNGEVETYTIERKAIAHAVSNLESFISALAVFSDPDSSRIFVNEHKVTLVVDDRQRDKLDWLLLKTHLFSRAADLDSGDWIDHDALLDLLKHDLHGVFPVSFVNSVTKVVVTSRQESEKQQGRDRGIQEFQTEIADAAGIPDTVIGRLSVFRGTPFEHGVTFTVRFNVQRMTWMLRPVRTDLENAVDSSLMGIQEALRNETTIPVLIGSP